MQFVIVNRCVTEMTTLWSSSILVVIVSCVIRLFQYKPNCFGSSVADIFLALYNMTRQRFETYIVSTLSMLPRVILHARQTSQLKLSYQVWWALLIFISFLSISWCRRSKVSILRFCGRRVLCFLCAGFFLDNRKSSTGMRISVNLNMVVAVV